MKVDRWEMTEAELRYHMSLICEGLRSRMHSHVDPRDNNTFLVQSERHISEMVETYLGKVFHFLFPLSSNPQIPPHNTSVLDREESVRRSDILRKRFHLDKDDLFEDPVVGPSLKKIREEFLRWITGSDSPQENYRREIWAACHLWLEGRIATGYRLLFLQGQNWQLNDATWDITRVVHDWPDTFTRSVFGHFRGDKNPFHGASSVPCTAICAFTNQSEKKDFERSSGLSDKDYIYLWAGRERDELSDFEDGQLVWFKNAGLLGEDHTLPTQPFEWFPRKGSFQERWQIFLDEIRKGFAVHGMDHFLALRRKFTSHLEGNSGELSGAFIRCAKTLKSVLRDKEYGERNCFWALQSVMFYDWKYWYLFPFSYDQLPRGGLTFSTSQPLTKEQIRLTAIFVRTFLQLFAEIEAWARSRIRERRRTNLHAAEDRVHEAWNKRALRGRAITEGHEKLFKWMLRDVVFGREDRQQAYSRSGQSDKWERENLKRTWLEGQKGDVVFAAMNYWNEATHAQGGRVFADWLSDPLLQEVPYDIWRERSEEYLKLTSEARKNSPKYYTLNDFLFDQAPRKEILEWRGYDWQIFPRSQDNPIDWVVEPPSVTPDVRRTLFKEIEHENLSVLNDGLAAECVRKIEHSVRVLKKALQQHLDHYSKKFEYEAANPGSKISSGLGLYDGDFGSLERVLKRLSDDVASIEDPGDSEVESSQEVTAEYLIRLAIYLNARMNTTEKDFLGVSKCAFITWALYHYYGPEALPLSEPADQRKKRWHFYSIPIHIPLPAQEGIQRTSILSLCTKNRLTDEELRLWRDVGSEIVLSTMMIDQHEEIRVSERERIRAGMAVGLYHQLGQVLYSVRARVRGLITEGQQLYDEITNIGEERTLDEVTQFAISKWPEHRDFSIRRLERLQLFRNFAFGQLTGVVENRNYASAKSVAEEALEQAKEYLLDDVPAGINLEFDDTLAQHVVNQDAYGFILQEIIANALRGASGPKPWVRINVTVEGNKAFINVTNSVSKEVYRKLKENPPEPSKEPGPERQSGRGLFGVYCLFQARRIEAPERIGPCKSREKFWFGFRCPIIDFYSASARQ